MLQKSTPLLRDPCGNPRISKIVRVVVFTPTATFPKGFPNNQATLQMRLHHDIILLPRQKPQTLGMLQNPILILIRRSHHQPKIIIDESLVITPRRSEIDQRYGTRIHIVQEIPPVGIGLHQTPREQFGHGDPKDGFGDAVPFGLVAVGEGLLDGYPRSPVHGEYLSSRVFRVDLGDIDAGELGIRRDQIPDFGLLGGLVGVIALGQQFQSSDTQYLVQIEAFGCHGGVFHQACQIVRIRFDRIGHPGVLHLHRQSLGRRVQEVGGVHLT
mmetsp:Transcript_1576/g.1864  ORF Transcript_1576/g.1864 Transcript_1576/m.1864 type:complete len:270 (-) Transcript_1576:499-1308(-)